MTDGEFAGEEFMQSLQIVTGAQVHIGIALSSWGGEPSVGHTLVLEVEHRRNQSDDEDGTTRFGLHEDSAAAICGQLLAAIDEAYGEQVVVNLLRRVAEYRVLQQQEKGERDG